MTERTNDANQPTLSTVTRILVILVQCTLVIIMTVIYLSYSCIFIIWHWYTWYSLTIIYLSNWLWYTRPRDSLSGVTRALLQRNYSAPGGNSPPSSCKTTLQPALQDNVPNVATHTSVHTWRQIGPPVGRTAYTHVSVWPPGRLMLTQHLI